MKLSIVVILALSLFACAVALPLAGTDDLQTAHDEAGSCFIRNTAATCQDEYEGRIYRIQFGEASGVGGVHRRQPSPKKKKKKKKVLVCRCGCAGAMAGWTRDARFGGALLCCRIMS